MPKEEKWLVRVVQIGLFAALIIPFITFKGLLFPFVYSKALLFQVLVEVLLLVYVPLIIKYPEYRPHLKSKITIGILIFFAALLLTTLTGVDIHRSLWATYARSTGVVALLHYLAFYFMFVSIMRDNWKRYIQAAAASGTLMAVIIIIQAVFASTERADGTLGNPGFAGTYLLFTFFFALAAYFFEEKKILKNIWLISLAIMLIALFFNATRAVFIGIAVSGIVAGALVPFLYPRFKTLKYGLGFGAIIVAGVVSILIVFLGFLPNSIYDQSNLLQRVRDISFVNNSRIITWDIGLKGFLSRPLVGYGPENFSHSFNKHFDSALVWAGGVGGEIDFDRAHNLFVETLVTMGIVGFAALLVLFIIAMHVLWKRKIHGGAPIGFIFFILIIAYVVQNMFTFDTPTSYMWLFVMFGIAGILERQNYASRITNHEKKRTILQGTAILGSAVVIGFMVIFIHIPATQASYAAARGKYSIDYDAVQAGIEFHKSLAINSVYQQEVVGIYAENYLDHSAETGVVLDEDLTYLKTALGPYVERYWQYPVLLARMDNLRCTEDRTACYSALEHIETALTLSTDRYQVYTEQYVSYTQLGDTENAEKSHARAVELGYTFGDDVYFYTQLGYEYAELGDFERALNAYEKAFYYDTENLEVMESLALAAYQVARYDRAREIAERMLEFAEDGETRMRVEEFLRLLNE